MSINQNNRPLISVIITCYNQEAVIAATLSSVLEQTYSTWECLVVDDGSIDQSAREIDKFVEKDERFSYLYQHNVGVASARNLGFSKSIGEYIQFLDADDLLLPEKLACQVDHFLSDETIDVSYSNHQHYFREKEQYKIFQFEEIDPLPLKQLLSGWQNGVSLPTHSPIFRRSIWSNNELPYPEDYSNRCEDWVFLVLVAARNKKFAYLDKVLCTYVIHNENFTRDIKESCIAAIQAAHYLEDKIPSDLQKDFVSDVIDRSLTRFHEAKKPEVLYASRNWQLGNLLTRPVFFLYRSVQKLFGRR